ncbi:hypothetical protein GCM10022261_11600 [Brevibacterium daeguense]|uniref:DUF308 domain-containing protein n=2 Tax=Brevibacterium daeguense TaxID=909936 RepID=A0ABP8EI37_9MICO
MGGDGADKGVHYTGAVMSGSSDPVSDSAPDSEQDSGRAAESTVSHARSMGTWMFVRGVLGFAFGMATIFWPRETLANATQLTLGVQTVDLVLIAYLVLSAVLLIGQSRRADPGVRTALLGQAVVVIPAVIFLFISDTPPELRAAVCIWALLHGGLELWIYWMQRSAAMASDHLIAAGCHLLLGVIVAFGSDMGALTVFGFAGAAVLISSVLYMLGGYSRRSRARA